MSSLSIRLRLTLWYAAVLMIGLVIFGAGLWFALSHRLMAGVDLQLAQRVDGLRTVLEVESSLKDPELLKLELVEFAREVPEGELMQLKEVNGAWFLTGSGAPPFQVESRSSSPFYSTANFKGGAYRILTTRFHASGRQYEALVASALRSSAAVLQDLRKLLILMIPGVLFIACLGGYWISGRALRPVDEITQVAKSISVQNLSRRLIVPKTGDELQRMSEAWNEVLERLEGAVARIRQFTADASHELKTPIALIRATSDLSLRRERTVEEYRRFMSEIREEADRMNELTESLLTLARSDASTLELPLTPTNLNEIVLDVVSHSGRLAHSKKITQQTRLEPGDLVILANAPAIRRLLLVLVDNALKYTPTGGTVLVSTKRVDGGILLSVDDTGEGIRVDALNRVFERFFRVDGARSAGSGVGLGLPIAQAIAEAHGSQISVDSAPGQGSRFELTLRTP